MAQIFHPSTNTIAKLTLWAAVLVLALLAWVCVSLDRSSYNTGQWIVRSQPVQFSHDHHVGGLGIDCRYCHSTVETSAFAGMPATATCMGCHQIIWADSPELFPVRESFRTGVPIAWTRVYDLPDFTYFNHAIHVQKGIGCASCHGEVDRIELMYQATSLKMQWCLDCHRRPEEQVRPRAAVFDMRAPAGGEGADGARLVAEHRIRDPFSLTNCSICHR
jgi:hypothetical protein